MNENGYRAVRNANSESNIMRQGSERSEGSYKVYYREQGQKHFKRHHLVKSCRPPENILDWYRRYPPKNNLEWKIVPIANHEAEALWKDCPF